MRGRQATLSADTRRARDSLCSCAHLGRCGDRRPAADRGARVAGNDHAADLRRRPSEPQPAVRPLRLGALQLSLHDARGADRPPRAGRLAQPPSRERVSPPHCPARSRRPDLQLPRQAHVARDVLREPLDQESADRLPRRLGGLWRRVQLPGFAQLGVDVARGLRDDRASRRERLDLGGQHRSGVRRAMARGAAVAAGPGGARPAGRAGQRGRRAPPVLLVEQCRRAGVGRLASRLSHRADGHARVHPHRAVAGGRQGPRPQRDSQSDRRPGVALHPWHARGLRRRLPSVHGQRHRARGGASRAPRPQGVVVGRRPRGARVANGALG